MSEPFHTSKPWSPSENEAMVSDDLRVPFQPMGTSRGDNHFRGDYTSVTGTVTVLLSQVCGCDTQTLTGLESSLFNLNKT